MSWCFSVDKIRSWCFSGRNQLKIKEISFDTPFDQDGGHVPDNRRIRFFHDELTELARAIRDGARVRSFHAWSLLDNFEWADGYSERYGLTYVDFRSQKRTPKNSALWYAKVAATNRLNT